MVLSSLNGPLGFHAFKVDLGSEVGGELGAAKRGREEGDKETTAPYLKY